MPTIHDNLEQGSLDWFRVRCGKVTASELHNLLTPEFKVRTGDTPKTYLCAKAAEAFRGEPLPGFTSWATEQGHMREDEARSWYELERDCDIRQVGFITADDGRSGCSPDGLIGEDEGIEIKCPEPTNHVRYYLDGELPKAYALQVHGSLYATGRKRWHFLSYRAGFPPFTITVQRDEAIVAKIAAALSTFYAQLDNALQSLRKTT